MSHTKEQSDILSAIRTAGQNYIAVKQDPNSTKAQQATAFSRLQSMATMGREKGLTITEIAFPAQLSRATVYAMIGEVRPPKHERFRLTRRQRADLEWKGRDE